MKSDDLQKASQDEEKKFSLSLFFFSVFFSLLQPLSLSREQNSERTRIRSALSSSGKARRRSLSILLLLLATTDGSREQTEGSPFTFSSRRHSAAVLGAYERKRRKKLMRRGKNSSPARDAPSGALRAPKWVSRECVSVPSAIVGLFPVPFFFWGGEGDE